MDPLVTWRRLEDAMLNCERPLIVDRARELIDWLNKGRFMPAETDWTGDVRSFVRYLRDIKRVAEMA